MHTSHSTPHAAQPSSGPVHTRAKMDVDLLNQQLIAHIEALEREGYVDAYFKMCHSLKENSGVTFFIELIATFLTDCGAALDDMTDTLEYPILDYEKLHELCIKLKGSSACIGACRLSSGCSNLIQAILNRSKKDCTQIVENLKQEKNTLERKLENIMQLEREIVDRQRQ